MIASDQPKIADNNLLIAVSSRSDGSIRHPSLDPLASDNLKKWCQTMNIDVDQIVGLYVTYGDGHTYRDIEVVDRPLSPEGAAIADGWKKADCIFSTTRGLSLILPVADCNAIVLFDPIKNILALAHVGWHATVNNILKDCIDTFRENYHSSPGDINVYISPSIRKQSYIFSSLSTTDDTRWHDEPYATKRDDGRYNIDLLRYNLDLLSESGVKHSNIEVSPIDTLVSKSYYSYTARHYPDHRDRSGGRFAILAMMR